VRLGRKATDQVDNLKAGLPKRGVVDVRGVGSQVKELRPYAQDLVFWESNAHSFRRFIPLRPEPFVVCFCSVLYVTGAREGRGGR
jgi:hypothetical protein